MKLALGHTEKGKEAMSEVKDASAVVRDVKRLRARFGSSTGRLQEKISALDAAASKLEATADELDKDEKELTALLSDLGSNFGPELDEVAPKKKGMW